MYYLILTLPGNFLPQYFFYFCNAKCETIFLRGLVKSLKRFSNVLLNLSKHFKGFFLKGNNILNLPKSALKKNFGVTSTSLRTYLLLITIVNNNNNNIIIIIIIIFFCNII